MTDHIRDSRRDFKKGVLLEEDLPQNPLELLRSWYQVAMESGEIDANAMSLATIDEDGYPVSRIVLMRELSAGGITFFTNYRSAKGRQLEAHPKAEVQFFWKSLERQVRVRGVVSRIAPAESDAYFASRPRESQLGAWASPQSSIIQSRADLEELLNKQADRFAKDVAIPRPPHWGGLRLSPVDFEFWQGRPNRLHDRLKAFLENDVWVWRRLAP